MSNISLFFKLGWKFFQRYLKEYLLILAKPFLLLILSFVFVPLCQTSPFFAIPAILITIPLSCWAAWKIYVIFYATIPASYDFLKNGAKTEFAEIVKNIKQKELISFALFSCVIYLIPLICIILAISINISRAANPATCDILSFIIFIITVIALITPFVFFSLQALYFKEDNENYFNLFKKCYQYLNIEAIMILVIIGLINFTFNLNIVLSIVSVLILPLFTNSVCTFWYYSRLQKKN